MYKEIEEKIKELIDFLNYHTKLYDEGKPEISDEEWDNKYFELVKLENQYRIHFLNSPTQKISYEVINELQKVEHNHLMLSLDKTKSIEDIKSFLNNKDYICMAKMDGLTCSLLYQDGKLVRAETRGNGIIGEDVTHNAKVIKSIPNTIAFKGNLVIDGEIICTYKDFLPYSDTYKNPRNFASGSIRLLDSKECAKRKLTFVAWDCIEGLPKEYNTLFSKLGKLEDLGFFCPPVETKDTASSEKEAIDKIIETAHMAEYPIDGVVFKFNNCDYYNSLGRTEHHFKGGLAYKFYDEEYKTELLDIDFNVSRMGVLTPVAVFKPIEIDGAEVSRASLHNMSIMWELLGKYPELYQPVYVVKSNQIIPQITRAKYKNDIPHDHILNSYPMTCPICGGFTSLSSSSDNAVTLYCDNPNCEGKIINRLDHFCGKKGLDIKGLSKATLEKLLDWGWIIDEESIFELGLYRDEWIKKPGFGEKSVDKILIAIQNACQCDLDAFISALGIPLIGRNVAKEICKNLATNDEFSYDEFRSLIINKFDFTEWEGFGEEKASSLLKFDYTTADIIANRYLTFNEKEKVEEGGLNDLIFVITGKLKNYKNRDALKLEIESRGGKVSGSVSSKTNYLINNDTTSESAKNLSAKKLGIPIISEGDFIEKFLK